MIILYNLTIFLISAGSKIAGIFHSKVRAFVTGRKEVFDELSAKMKHNTAPVVWMHCASLGEFEQGRPILERIRAEFPQYKILLSFFSPSGYEVRKNYPGADVITYLPVDTGANAKKFLIITKPVLAIFVKYEFWYHYSTQLKRNNIPQISVSSIFREGQFFFSKPAGFYRGILRNFDHFFVQNQESVRLLQAIGIDKVTLSGDTRFDRVREIVKRAEGIPVAHRFKNKQKVMVIGSCWEEDLEVLVPFINENRLKFIVAPHEIHEADLVKMERLLEVPSVRYSRSGPGDDLSDVNVLIIDNIGMLSRLYQYGEYAFIGGGFGKGLHNILEAACYGIPVFFGNRNYRKFQEAVDLINLGGAFSIRDYPELREKYEMLNEPENFQLACEVTRLYVDEHAGATAKVISYCSKLLAEKVHTS